MTTKCQYCECDHAETGPCPTQMEIDGSVEMSAWKPGDSFCGTPIEAINYALDTLASSYDCSLFLEDWRAGDLRDWPEFTFKANTI